MNSFKTPKGTTLPLLDLKGKSYLQVAHRIQWFREEHPDWRIRTDVRYFEAGKYAVICATICNEQGEVMATAHKQETSEGFFDFIEKAETGAIGRALALCGYGTQFTDDLEEGERLADAPLSRAPTAAGKPSPQTPSAVVGTTSNKWDHSTAKSYSPVGKILRLCEQYHWDKKDAGNLCKEKFGDWQFSKLLPSQVDWLCTTISTLTPDDAFEALRIEAKDALRANPPSAMFDEMNPPPMTEEDIPF